MALFQKRKRCRDMFKASEEKGLSSYGFREDFAQRRERRRRSNQAAFVLIVRSPVVSPCWWAKDNISKAKHGQRTKWWQDFLKLFDVFSHITGI